MDLFGELIYEYDIAFVHFETKVCIYDVSIELMML